MDPIYKSYIIEAYGHTMWIDPKGKIIDISGGRSVHWQWLQHKLSIPYNDVYAAGASRGWIQVRNRAGEISLIGMKQAFSKSRKTIFDIIDDKLFNQKDSSFFIDIVFVNDVGDPEGKRYSFEMPNEDSKFRRFI